MKAISRSNVYFSVIITTLLFISLLVMCAPIMDSDDNFYILYTLAGGYGNKPTHLLHYYYEWHPLLFWPIARLFDYFPDFNWYTGFLLLLQWIGCINLLYLFLLFFKRSFALVLFSLFFLFIESRFLLSLNDSNTSFLLAISGCSSFLCYFLTKNTVEESNWKNLILPALLILAGGLLRVHTTALYLLLSLSMGLFQLPFHQYRKFAGMLLLLGIVLAAFVEGHKYFYELKIPNTKAEERFRQSLFHLANHPHTANIQDTGTSRIKGSFIAATFLYDTNFVSSTDIERYSKKNVNSNIVQGREYKQAFYWFFMGVRVYLLFLTIIFFFFLTTGNLKDVQRWLLMSVPGLLVFLYLTVFMKVTEGIFITLLSSVFLSAVFGIRTVAFRRTPLTLPIMVLLGFNVFWMVRIIKMNNDVRTAKIRLTRAQLKEISTHPQYLFINTDKEFRDRAFYIWDTPSEYPLKNLIHKEQIINNSYQQVLERFHIRDLMQELPYRSDILLFNRIDPLLKEYYGQLKGINIEIIPIPGFSKLKAQQIRLIKEN